MKTKLIQISFLLPLTIFFCGCQSNTVHPSNTDSDFLIDDFNTLDANSPLGTRWQKFTDQVMGGVSTAKHTFETIDGKNCIRLTGNVSLENDGGFIMVTLDLDLDGKKVDMTGYKGVRITAKGKKGNYFIQLRTSDNWFPWQFFMAKFNVSDSWQTIEIPFDDFISENTSRSLNVSKTKKIAILAYKKAFTADVAVAKIEFYKTK